MDTVGDGATHHDRYLELCAVATSGTLSRSEQDELRAHLAVCANCREAYRQFCSVTSEVVPLLTPDCAVSEDSISWDASKAETRLFAAIDRERVQVQAPSMWKTTRQNLAAFSAVAACLLIAVGFAAYRAGERAHQPAFSPAPNPGANPDAARLRALSDERQSLQQQVALDSAALQKLESANALKQKAKQEEIDKLQAALSATEGRLREARASDSSRTEQLQALGNERDTLAQQLRGAQQAYKTVEEELNNLRDQRSRAVLRAASLDSDVQRLSERLRQQDRLLRDHEQYLASDRDIRELMGARQLYIADVFDVDKNGNKRKPFGRVFYTKEKSLIFYAFDLDQQPGVKNASAFQAWGQRDSKEAKPLNLGILYMDNEANRRWVLQFDDPSQLAQIDAVFVTVEPHGGSEKPTGKPLLYASLRKLPNHP